MANNKNTQTAPKPVFGVWEEPVKINPYASLMADFLAASEANPKASYTLEIATEKAITERNKFAKAANDIGKTANVRNTEERDGITYITFTLGKRHKARNVKNRTA